MRMSIVAVLMALALMVLLLPEVSRYSAERDLGTANAA